MPRKAKGPGQAADAAPRQPDGTQQALPATAGGFAGQDEMPLFAPSDKGDLDERNPVDSEKLARFFEANDDGAEADERGEQGDEPEGDGEDAASQPDTKWPFAEPAADDAAAEDTDDDGTPDFRSTWDGLSDEDLTSRIEGMSPKQLRAALGNGEAMQRRFNRGLNELAQQRQELGSLHQQLIATQQQLLTAQTQGPAPSSPPGPPAPRSVAECLDPDTGEVDLAKLDAYEKARETALMGHMEERLKPFMTKVDQREQADAEREQLQAIEGLKKQHAQMLKDYPHYRDEDVQREVVQYMREKGVGSFEVAYGTLFEDQWAAQKVLNKRKELTAAGRAQQRGAATKPTPPPGRNAGRDTTVTLDENQRLAAMAAQLEKGLGARRR